MFPLMPGFARPLNTSEVSGRDSLRGLYKDSLTYDNPLRLQVKAVITLPNEVVPLLRTIYQYASRGPNYTPTIQPLLPLPVRLS
jgi:hypothetical protein